MSLPCLLNWISIKAFRAHSYFQAQSSTLTSEYQIESGVLRRAACKAVRMTLSITLSRFRFQTTVTGAFPTSHLNLDVHRHPRQPLPPTQGLLDPLTCDVYWGMEGWPETVGRSFPWWHFFPSETRRHSPRRAADHTVCQHILCSPVLSVCVSCPLDHTKIELLGAWSMKHDIR